MKLKLIKTAAEYETALARVDELFDSKPGSPLFDEAELLITLVDLYEQEHFKIEALDPIAAIEFRME
jgi:HTH-type transcriptional regulator/antitoxin HigA